MARQLSTRERGLLVVLAIAVLGTAWYLVGRDESDGPKRGGAGQEMAELPGEAPDVLMSLLTRGAEPYDPRGRDLFKFGVRPPSPEELAAREAREDRQRQLQEQAMERRAQAQTPKPVVRRDTGPRAPRPTFRYLGYLGPKEDRIAVFENKDELVLAKVGELVEEDFRVAEIQYESVVLGFTDPRFENRTETLEMAGK